MGLLETFPNIKGIPENKNSGIRKPPPNSEEESGGRNSPLPPTPPATQEPGSNAIPDYDPNMPVYASPDAVVNNKGVNDYINQGTGTVEGRVNNMVSNGSPLLELARSDMNLEFHKRGLDRSGMAASGGELAVLRQATDIAKPDAAAQTQFGLQQQQADNQQNTELLRGQISGNLTAQENLGKVELTKIANTAQMQRIAFDNQWKDYLNTKQFDAATRERVAVAAQTLGAEYQSSVERILRDPNIENKTDAIKALQTIYQNNLNMVSQVAGMDITWS